MGLEYTTLLEELAQKYGRNYEIGSVIFEENDPGTEVYFILSGKVRISVTYQSKNSSREASGNFHELAQLSAGDVFGEMAILDEMPRSATATTAEFTRVVVLTKEQFFENVRRYPELAIKVLALLGQRIRRADEKLKRALSYIAFYR